VETQSSDPDDRTRDKAYRDDVKPGDYTKESAPVKAFLGDLKPEDMFQHTFDAGRDWLKRQPVATRFVPSADQSRDEPRAAGRRVVSERYFYDLVAAMCQKWFGLTAKPNAVDFGGPEGQVPHCPIDLVRGSFYIFWPHPSEAPKAASEAGTGAIRDAMRDWVTAHPLPSGDGTLLDSLLHAYPDPTPAQKIWIADTVVNTASGFAGPTSGSFRFVLYDWIDTSRLWRLQQRILPLGETPEFADVAAILQPEILNSMAKRAAPDLLHREVVKTTQIGSETVKAGNRVVMSLRSATEDAIAKGCPASEAQSYYLFGGDPSGPDRTQHGCTGRSMALSAMMGAFSAIMTFGDIRPEGPLNVRLYAFRE
jgi:hypothetical protein